MLEFNQSKKKSRCSTPEVRYSGQHKREKQQQQYINQCCIVNTVQRYEYYLYYITESVPASRLLSVQNVCSQPPGPVLLALYRNTPEYSSSSMDGVVSSRTSL